MEITFQLTEDDYCHGLITKRNASAWSGSFYRYGAFVMAPLLIINVIFLIWSPVWITGVKWISSIGISASMLSLFTIWISPRLYARLQYRRIPSAHSPMAMTVSGSEIHFRSQHFDSHIAWSMFISWTEGKSLFLLFPQPHLYAIIPKRAFSKDQLAEFREILRRNIASK